MQYAKFWTALAAAAVIVVGQLVGVNSVWYNDLVVVLGALGVYAVPNRQ